MTIEELKKLPYFEERDVTKEKVGDFYQLKIGTTEDQIKALKESGFNVGTLSFMEVISKYNYEVKMFAYNIDFKKELEDLKRVMSEKKKKEKDFQKDLEEYVINLENYTLNCKKQIEDLKKKK